jgi:capsular exopolysaccharide synthesis family protein
MENTSGISNIMVKQSNLDDIIHSTNVKGLSFITAGPVLPNPSELISAGALDDFFSIIQTKFDFIIIDTAPIGLVSDSIQLMKYASQVIVVTRNNHTKKEILENAINSLVANNISNYDIVFNDLNLEKSPYSSYKGYYHK